LASPLDSALQRVKRTEKHLADLDAEIVSFQEAQGQFRWHELNEEQIAEHWAQAEKTLPPDIISVLIGEIAYNLRVALDYLVYGLAAIDSGSIQNGTQFPIEDDPEVFRGRQTGKHPVTGRPVARYLIGINIAHVALIEKLQPYNGCDWTKLLRTLSNPDKHRYPAVIIRPSRMRMRGRHVITQTGPDTFNHEMIMEDAWSEVHVVFHDGTPIVETLQTLKSQVTDTLKLFESDFAVSIMPAHDPPPLR
jgi:hypothetical protein